MKTGTLLLMLCAGLIGCRGGESTGAKPDKQQQGGASQGTSAQQGSEEGSKSSGEGSVPADAVRIAPADQPRAGIQWAPVTVRSMPRLVSVPGQVALNERNTEHIGALADGRIETVSVLPGDTVRRGQTLATVHSHMVHETAAALTQAFAAVARQKSAVVFATQARDRYAKLYGIQAASLEEKQRSEQELAQANQNLTDAEATERAEREHLSELLQVVPASLTPDTLYNRELVPIRAVASGVVISRSITVGQVVNTGDEAFVTSNLTSVWVNAAVNEKDLPLVRAGVRASVKQTGTEAPATPGTVMLLGDLLDAQTRTLPVRILVPNPGMRLRPGMFVLADIAAPMTRTAIFVPPDAMQDVNGIRVVFVTDDGSTFHARAVQTGGQANGMVEVTQGLSPKDHVVVKGAFMVKGELLKGTVGEG